jgi:AraC-like DNA-binding protein
LNGTAKSAAAIDGVPVLGQALGAYRERAAQPLLGRDFARVWFHAVPEDAPGRSAIVPDGCADLIWFDGALRIAGPDRQAKIETVPPGKTVIGMRFQPGAAFRWLGVPASDVVDDRVALESFWGAEARALEAWIGEAASPEEIARRLERGLAARVFRVAEADALAPVIFRIVRSRRDYALPVGRQLIDLIGGSERTLRRRCHEAFGYGPKTLDRILRFKRFLRLARASGAVGMADLAAGAGYADQPHLTRETRHLAGMTPKSIVAQLGARRIS